MLWMKIFSSSWILQHNRLKSPNNTDRGLLRAKKKGDLRLTESVDRLATPALKSFDNQAQEQTLTVNRRWLDPNLFSAQTLPELP